MIKRCISLAVLATLVSVCGGCGLFYNVAYCPLGPCGGHGGGRMVGSACGPMASDTCGPVGCGEVGCGDVGCAPDCCDPCCRPYRPFARLACLADLFRPITWCGPVCGERYWGDFYSDPPDCSDPCDPCGNYVGGRPPQWPHCPNGRFRGFLGLLFGPHTHGGCGSCVECANVGCVAPCGGCDTCGPTPGS